jgi:hypothetical protein
MGKFGLNAAAALMAIDSLCEPSPVSQELTDHPRGSPTTLLCVLRGTQTYNCMLDCALASWRHGWTSFHVPPTTRYFIRLPAVCSTVITVKGSHLAPKFMGEPCTPVMVMTQGDTFCIKPTKQFLLYIAYSAPYLSCQYKISSPTRGRGGGAQRAAHVSNITRDKVCVHHERHIVLRGDDGHGDCTVGDELREKVAHFMDGQSINGHGLDII